MVYICRHCDKSFKRDGGVSYGYYCSNRCQMDFQYFQRLQKWFEGIDPGWTGHTVQLKPFIRRYLLEKYNYACVLCGWDQRHPIDGKPLVEIDHVDGNAKNCAEENLRVLCPNCHSMTPTFRARNPASVRKRA